MPNFMMFRTDKVYVTDGTIAGTKAVAGNSRYVATRTDTDITQTDGRLTFFRDASGIKAMDAATGQIHAVPGFNTGNFWPGFSAALPGNSFVMQSPGILYRYGVDQVPVRISDDLGASYSQELISFAGQVFFRGSDSFGQFVGVSDGTPTGTVKFMSRNEDGALLRRLEMDQDWIVNGRMIFAGVERETNSQELYATDGTQAGTVRLADDIGQQQSDLVKLGNRFLFHAQGDDGAAVWSTDATRTGTIKVADTDSLLTALATGTGITLAPGYPHGLIGSLTPPFVVRGRAYVAVDTRIYDLRNDPVWDDITQLSVFDVTGTAPVLVRTLDRDLDLINAQGDAYLFGGSDNARPAVSASGVMFLFRQSDKTVYAAQLAGGAPVPVYKVTDEYFGAQFDLGSHMVFKAGRGSLISIDLATLKATVIARDVAELDDLRLLGDRLYWKDGRGVHVTDGTSGGTVMLAGTVDGIESSVIGVLPLAAGRFERLVTTGDDVINLPGSTRDERIDSGAGNDRIRTGSGDDTLIGGLGTDRMEGGRGDDVYYVDTIRDRVVEAAGGGIDRVFASSSWVLPAHVESLILTGSQAINADGNAGNDRLTGNVGSNRLRGFDGHDTLDGGRGIDRMEGGSGNDLYHVDNARDLLIEISGRDRVMAAVDWILATGFEDLTLTGTARNGAGNAAHNQIRGNAESNRLWGHGGNDVMAGGAGNDVMAGGSGDDRLDGGAGMDRLIGGTGRDLLSGGIDTLRDVFVFSSIGDSRPGASRDQILDFQAGRDDIDLSAIDADTRRSGVQDFDFTGTRAASHAVWQIIGSQGVLVRADTTGDSRPDLEIWVAGIARLAETDFIF